MENIKSARENRMGILYAFVAFSWWGLFPLYWKLLKGVSSVEILASRIIWSFVLTFLIIFFRGDLSKFISMLKDRKTVIRLFMASTFMSLNWGSYIFAVNSGKILEASLGQYLIPLMMVILGVVVFKEKLGPTQILSISLASAGVLLLTLKYGKFPWVSMIIAITFSLYSVFKKKVKTGVLMGLVLETAIIAPFALLYITSVSMHGSVAFGTSLRTSLLLVGAGAVTTLPLFLFAKSAQKIDLSAIAFFQYFTPTISLFLGVFLYKEPFSSAHLISFSLIWAAILVYSVGLIKELSKKS